MKSMEFEFEVEELVEVIEDQENDEERDLVVYNDDFNTFEHVTKTLIKVCKHEVQQAEQCTYLIHHKGRCAVKRGSYLKLRPMREGITDAGIKAAIE